MRGYYMTLDIAEKFFKRCAELDAKTLEERLTIMNELIHEENIKILDEKGLAKTLKGKKILRIKQ